ncbi:MAG: hypothetical protein QW103_02355 [Candidatus Pacearchaeota archaeon]
MQDYDFIVKKISSLTGLDKEDIERKIEMKIAKLSGLISKSGAAQILASELGINFEDTPLKIAELMPGMKKVRTLVKIIKIFPVRSFNKNGRNGKIASFLAADDSGSIRVVLWDTNHISLIEKNELKEGDIVELINASVRDSEVHLSGFSDLKKSSLLIQEVKINEEFVDKKIKDLRLGESAKIKGTIVQIFPPKFFNVCSQCGKKVVKLEEGFFCDIHGKTENKEKALVVFILDDGTENIRAIVFSEKIQIYFGENELNSDIGFNRFKENFLGEEVSVSGNVRKNQLNSNLELNVQQFEILKVENFLN